MINEDLLEQKAIEWLKETGYETVCGYDIAPDSNQPARDNYTQVILVDRLKERLQLINPNLPNQAIKDAIDQIKSLPHISLIQNNQEFYQWLIEGVKVEYRENDRMKGDYVKLVDFDNVNNNDFLAVNQFTVQGTQHNRRPDIVIFINGLPLIIVELKNTADETTDVWKAYDKLQDYKKTISDLFLYNLALIISDGIFAKIGSLTATRDRFMPWRYVVDEQDEPKFEFELETLIKGFFNRTLLLDYIHYFVVFETDADTLEKKIAGYHQFHAVRDAIQKSLIASRPEGDKRCGVFWHTQGSGKSLSMACYAGKLIAESKMENPTLVVVTDRNDLDDQLFKAFCQAKLLLKQTPIQVENREDLRYQLKIRPVGGVIFTTIQMFMKLNEESKFPELSNRHNIIVMADECHRSHYGLNARLNRQTGQYEYGYAKHLRDALPNASFIGFTGTPIELVDKNTRTVFGDYISIYDVQQAEKDGAIVPIYYESRLIELHINQEMLEEAENEIALLTEKEEVEYREKLKGRWAGLTSIVGSEPRVQKIAKDIIEHFNARLQMVDGKAMIVGMSRQICVSLYNALVALKPEWHSDDPKKGVLKIVMTGNSDDNEFLKPHIYNKSIRKELENRFKDPKDPLKIVIVRDMWLTGFNVPCLHTMYVDKPMQGHNLMQAITRVNRVFQDKPGGVIVDYIGIAHEIRKAVKNYTENNGHGKPVHEADEAFSLFIEKLDVIRGMLHGFDFSLFDTDPLSILLDATDYILNLNDGKRRFIDAVTVLSKAYSLCKTLDKAKEYMEEVAFFQAMRATLIKHTVTPQKQSAEVHDIYIKQLISRTVSSMGIIDIYKELGVEKPDISILSKEFLEHIPNIKQKNLAVELLEKLMLDQIKMRTKENVVQEKQFIERLTTTINKYHSRAIETAQVIEELIQIAKDFKHAKERGAKLGLSDQELAFYDALANNESAVRELKEETLKKIAIELTEKLRKSTKVDWQVRESVRAELRIMVKNILKKYKYPPDQQQIATDLVLQQAESLSAQWSRAEYSLSA